MSVATHDIADNGSLYVRIGLTGLIQTSPDGNNWTVRTSGVSVDLWGIVYGLGKFVVVGADGTILSSTDGITWASQTSGTSEHLYAIDANLDVYIAVGANGASLISLDAYIWIDAFSDTTEILWGVSAGSGQWIAVGANSTIVVKPLVVTDTSGELYDGMGLGETSVETGTYNIDLEDEVGMDMTDHFQAFLQDNWTLTHSISTAGSTWNISASDAMTFFMTRIWEGSEALSDGLSMNDSTLAHFVGILLDSFAVDDDLDTLISLAVYLTDSFTIDDTLAGKMTATLRLSDAAGLDDTLASSQTFQAALSEAMSFGLGLELDGVEYEGWALNLKNFALTKYSGYNFNSMGFSDGVTLGADSTGIYELSGSDDDGTDIDAFARFGVTDFDIKHKLNVREAYLGIRKDGEMVIKTITNEHLERWYHLKSTHDGMGTERVKFAKGVKSGYWQFEVHNKDGGDFDLDYMEVIPMVLKRRKR